MILQIWEATTATGIKMDSYCQGAH